MQSALPLAESTSPALPDASAGRLLNGSGLSRSDADALARQVVEDHREGKRARWMKILTSQKYAYHLHGEGDAQWADIIGGREVKVPRRRKGALRYQDNILRPMVDYWVAYHCAQPLRSIAESRADRRSRDRARIDTLVANHHLREQRINDRAAEAMYMASFNGFGILHSMWRNDVLQSGEETGAPYSQRVAAPGFVDVFPGNPFDTVWAPTASRASLPWYSYGRTLPAQVVRDAFADAPGIERLAGSDREPSTSWFQRLLRRWDFGSPSHGSALLTGSGTEEAVALVCREVLPGQFREYPGGLLIVVALSGASETGGFDGGGGSPMLLHMGPLPGAVPSATRFYAGFNGDDVDGKAYIADLDDDQIRLNQAITMYAEMMSAYAYPQLFVQQGTQLLANSQLGNRILEYVGQSAPQYQFPGSGANFGAILQYIQDIREAAFRKGGWQAASRGESSGAGEPFAKAAFLAQQDKSIFANSANAFRSSVVELLRKNHALRLQYQTLPLLVDVVGEEFGYLAEEYIHRDQMSATPPNFSLVSGMGATPDARVQELNALVQMADAEHTPLLPARRFWQLHPDPGLRPNDPDLDEIRKRRAQAINVEIERVCQDFEANPREILPPEVAANPVPYLLQQVTARFDLVRSDAYAIPLYLETLDALVLEPSTPPLVRAVAVAQQERLFAWQAQMAAPEPQAGPQAGPAQQDLGMSMQGAPQTQVAGPKMVPGVSPLAAGM